MAAPKAPFPVLPSALLSDEQIAAMLSDAQAERVADVVELTPEGKGRTLKRYAIGGACGVIVGGVVGALLARR